MRNLVVTTEEHGVVDDNTTLQVAAAAVDVDNGFFFVASQAPMLICYSLRSSKVNHLHTNHTFGIGMKGNSVSTVNLSPIHLHIFIVLL